MLDNKSVIIGYSGHAYVVGDSYISKGNNIDYYTNLIEVTSRKNRHGSDFSFYLDWDINRGVIKELYDYSPPA